MNVFDFAVLSLSFLLFLLFLLLAIMFRKSTVLFLLLFVLALSSIIAAPIISNMIVKGYVNKSNLTLKIDRRLQFYDAYMLSGMITNEGRRDFKECTIDFEAYKEGANFLKTFVNRYFKPLEKRELVVHGPIKMGESKDFKFLVDGFTYHDFKVTIKNRCY